MFKVGDKVRVTNTWSGFFDMVGVVTEVDDHSSYNVIVMLEDEEKPYDEVPFSDNELELVNV